MANRGFKFKWHMLLLSCVLCPSAAVQAGDPVVDRAEQMEFDPATGEWKEIPPLVAGTPEGDLALARRLLANGEISKTKRATKKWLKTHGADHPLARQAELLRADAETADRHFYKAHGILGEMIGEFGLDDVTQRAVELDFIIAEVFLGGTKRRWWGMRIASAEDIAIEILDRIAADYPDTGIGENALKTKADYFFNRGDFDLAEDEYARLIESYPRSRYVRPATLRRAQASLARFPGTKFDDAPLIEAEERFMQFREIYPAGAEQHNVDLVLEDISNTRAQKELEIGQYYIRVGKPQAGMFYYHSVIDHWPGTSAATRAQSALADMGEDFAPATRGG